MSEHTTVSQMSGKHNTADKIGFKNSQLFLMLFIFRKTVYYTKASTSSSLHNIYYYLLL